MDNSLQKFDAQRVRIGVTLILPIQYDTHSSHIEERLRNALQKEFKDELQATQAMLWSVKDESRPLYTMVLTTDYSRDAFTEPIIRSRTHLSPIRARKILRTKYEHMIEAVEEYIGEAEHQDGDEYWRQFHNEADLREDFDLFLEFWKFANDPE